MRISDHVLEIERGRYNKINREQRICRMIGAAWMIGAASCIRHEEDKKKWEILNMIISHQFCV
jgi:hypothetical protein